MEPQCLALPKLPHRLRWHPVVNTADKEKPFCEVLQPVEKKHQIEVPPQAIVILIGK